MIGNKLASSLLIVLAVVSIGGCSSSGNTGVEEGFQTEGQEGGGVRPAYLPVDLPIPEGAGIVHSDGHLEGGKKSSMLIYETNVSMNKLGATYKKYVDNKSLKRGTQIVEQDNIVINGKVEDDYSYSIIGSDVASKPGTAEIIVTWVEN